MTKTWSRIQQLHFTGGIAGESRNIGIGDVRLLNTTTVV